jgi:hypothetical protein
MNTTTQIVLVTLAFAAPLPAATRYVNLNNPTPSAPYTSWATAATRIQDAVDAAAAGDLVLVTNGVYATGERVTPGYACSNRVVITNAIEVRSVNGPEVTVIKGLGPWSTSAVRCVYMTAGIISGFTMTNGFTQKSGDYDFDRSGGGIHMLAGNGMVSNCVISGSHAETFGGGVYGGTVQYSTILWNAAANDGGGACSSTVHHCTLYRNNTLWTGGGVNMCVVNDCDIIWNGANCGGGASYSSVSNCAIIRNGTDFDGGGTYFCAVINCLITNNIAERGGGTYGGTVHDCTISRNSATLHGGGTRDGIVSHCLVVSNMAAVNGGGTCYGTIVNSTISDNRIYYYGGGTYGSIVSNSTVNGNRAVYYGGGSYGGMLYNCLIVSNSAGINGGGTYTGILNNCTICNNYATNSGGGTCHATLRNSIVWANTAGQSNNNHGACSFVFSCTTPLPGGLGNISDNPSLWGGYCLADGSVCIDTGTNAYAPMPYDLAGNPRIYNSIVDMGCHEYVPEPLLWHVWASLPALVWLRRYANNRRARGH